MEEKASVSRVKKIIGTYKFRVEGYSALSTKVGDSIESPEFLLCGYTWQLRIFPGGYYYLMAPDAVINHHILQILGGIDESFSSSGVRTFEPKGLQVDGWGRDKFITILFLLDSRNGLFVDDSVVFKVEICVIGDLECNSQSDQSAGNQMTLEHCMKKMLHNATLSDISFQVGDTTLKAHRCILSSRSPVFQSMFASQMLEAQTGIITVEDVSPEVLKEFLHYLYTDEISSTSILESMAEELFCVASKYQVAGLLTLCEDNICSKIMSENVFPILAIGDAYGSSRIRERAIQYIVQNHGQFQKKDLTLLDTHLAEEVQFALDMARRKQGCLGNNESEKRFGGSCAVM